MLAVKLQALNKELEWDEEKMEFTNISDSERLKICVYDYFSIVDNDPCYDRKWTESINAKQYVAEMIKHTYRKVWPFPDITVG